MSVEELEGFASWVEIDMMTKLGEIQYANMLKQQLFARDDEYGRGYRIILEKLAKYLINITPFDLFLQAVN